MNQTDRAFHQKLTQALPDTKELTRRRIHRTCKARLGGSVAALLGEEVRITRGPCLHWFDQGRETVINLLIEGDYPLIWIFEEETGLLLAT